MALIICKECSKEVSDQAKACVHCGAPLMPAAGKGGNTGKILMGLVGAVALVFVILMTIGASDGPESSATMAAQKAVAEMLKDPDSAKFRATYTVTKNGDVAVCGEVSGKNSYGAYAGYSRFVAAHGVATLESSDNKNATVETVDTNKRESIFEKAYWNSSCVDGGHPPTYTGENWRR